ncbi:EexN family lipoprotein [Paraburkholderia strydomiana]|uniref:EexN family lipoprotein n=1 Tax=Paraburkholderia strydomiana TaxID=1245417 RepID=A0ABW9EIN1_9BURK
MKKSDPIVMACMLLAACGKATPADTVNSLVAHPDHLREVEKQCADDYAKMGSAECNNASEARHRLFMGNGPQYTPPKDQPKF